jgi:hypothetical protein
MAKLNLPKSPEITASAIGVEANAVVVHRADVGHSTKTKYVLLNLPTVGMLAFPIPLAERIAAMFTENIAKLKEMK